MKEQISLLGLKKIISLIEKKEISCLEVTKACIEKIEELDSAIGAFITVRNKEELLKEAQESDERRKRGESLSIIDGIPIAIKDNIHVMGCRTTCASKILESYTPPFDATVVQKLKNNGAIIIGKTNLDEFAMGSTTETSAFFPTKNPFDLTRVAGGSSGGSAACIASGMSILALGSDTGGSIRQPASFCGIYGLKPTYGLVSRYGLVSYASSLDQIGPMSKDVYGLACLLNIISGFDKYDSTSLKTNPQDYTKILNASLKGKKIAIISEFFQEGIIPEIKNVFFETVKIFEDYGAIVENVSLNIIHYIVPAYYFIATAEASSNLARYDGVKYGFRSENQKDYEEMLFSTRTIGFGKEVKKRILLGNFVLSSGYYDEYYKKAQKIRKLIMEELKELFKNYDVVALPTTPDLPYKLNESLIDPLKIYLSDVTTVIANLAGLPAISIPVGLIEGLPVGIQLISGALKEDVLLQFANKIEEAMPPIHVNMEKLKDEVKNHKKNEGIKVNKEKNVIFYSESKINEISKSYKTKNINNRILIKDLNKYIGEKVTVSGWIHKIYSLGGIDFLILRDRTGFVQVVIEAEKTEKELTCESVIKVNGVVKHEERSPYNKIELKVDSKNDIEIYSKAKNNLPININGYYENITLPTLLDNRPLSVRIPKVTKIFKIQSEIIRIFSDFLRKNDFVEIKTPKLLSTGTEGGTNIFEVRYFNNKAFLAQSPQFYKQIMIGSGFERVFEIGPVFRAELHDTVRHLNEYTSLDFEMAFIENEQDIIDLQESLILSMINELTEKYNDILNEFNSTIKIPDRIPRIHFIEALKILEKNGIKDLDGDISPEGEKAICEYFEKEANSSFVYIIGYPLNKRPMYTMPDERLPGYSRSFDLLFKGLEITTGGQRIHNYEFLKESIKKKGYNPDDFKDYLLAFKYGMPPHGGLGMGLERLTMKLLNLSNIREATLFPRDRNRLSP